MLMITRLEEAALRREAIIKLKFSRDFYDGSIDTYLIEAIKAKMLVTCSKNIFQIVAIDFFVARFRRNFRVALL